MDLATVCPQQPTEEDCLAVPDAEPGQEQCHWLELALFDEACADLGSTARCEYLPWVGDAVTLAGQCGETEGAGVAYRETPDGIETLEAELYGVEITALEGWETCLYDGDDPPVCACFCDA